MLHSRTQSAVHARVCPDCGHQLETDQDLFRCEQHGTFFAYGPHLLVRLEQEVTAQLPGTLLPWENHATRRRA